MSTVCLTSTSLVHTPGIVRWATSVYRAGQRDFAVTLVAKTYSLNKRVARLILSGKIEVEIDDDQGTVTFATSLPYRL